MTKIAKALENEFMDSSQPARNVTTNAFPELITTQTTVLGEIRAQLQALQEQPRGWVTREPTEDTTATEQIVSTHKPHILPLLADVIRAVATGDEGSWELNIAALSREILYLLQEGVTQEFRAREGRAFHILTEQKAKIK